MTKTAFRELGFIKKQENLLGKKHIYYVCYFLINITFNNND